MQPVPDITSKSAVPDSPVIAPWHEIVQATLKRNDVKLVAYVPDNVFTPLIKNLHADKTCSRRSSRTSMPTRSF